MPNAQTIDVGRHRVTLEARETVTPPTPYTLLLAESIPELSGLTVVDIGTGSGILAIVACLQGASRVYILDTNPAAVEAALQNAELNGVQDRFIHLPIGRSIIPLPSGETVDVVISNPAQLPLPKAAEAHHPYYSGPDGRQMIDEVITATPARLSPGGRLFMVQNSVTDFPKSIAMMQAVGLKPRVVKEQSLELRPLFDRAWLDELGGTTRGLYTVSDGHCPTRRSTQWRRGCNKTRRVYSAALCRARHPARRPSDCRQRYRPMGRLASAHSLSSMTGAQCRGGTLAATRWERLHRAYPVDPLGESPEGKALPGSVRVQRSMTVTYPCRIRRSIRLDATVQGSITAHDDDIERSIGSWRVGDTICS